MAERKEITWLLVNGGRELSWFLAWAAFCTEMTLGRSYPFGAALFAFALAFFLTRLSLGRGWRIVQVILMEMMGLMAVALMLFHGLYYADEPLFASHWLLALVAGPQGVTAWFHFLLQLLLILALWWNGVALARRPRGYAQACLRFDLGLASFFVLFSIKLVALIKGSAKLEEPLSILFLYPFFLFALAAIGLEKLRANGTRTFLPRYRGIGVIASFAMLVLLTSGAIFLFLQPALQAAARMGYRTATALVNPLKPAMIAVLRFMFGPRSRPSPPPPESTSLQTHWEPLLSPQQWWMKLMEQVLGWGLWGLMLLGLAVGLTILLCLTVRWLFSRTARRDATGSSIARRPWWQDLWRVLAQCRWGLFYALRGHPTGAALYGALQGWAIRSHLAPGRAETPGEFGSRLERRFPSLQRPVAGIISAYQREVYGEERLDKAVIAAVNAEWRTLRSPRLWPARFKAWLVNGPVAETEKRGKDPCWSLKGIKGQGQGE